MKTFTKITFSILAIVFTASGIANAQTSDKMAPKQAEAVFAGGCFWCVEADFEKFPGVIEAVSGYAGGHTQDPTYKQVTRNNTGHYEVAKIIYDPAKVSYSELVEYFWTTVDPTDAGGQFCDRGQSYATAIFATPGQIEVARASKTALESSGRLKDKVVTPILPAARFYKAENYHQDYYKKNPIRYNYYRTGCRRDKRLKKLWGKKGR
ncbi:MAG: peptide-methionine (S)-S-oxide reductase MsrA [Robiginitomaculum sp.]|nr:peptide-methionine (S)-S-oxide reductase MsrA [Robiginitomaculum sp.]